MKKSAGQLLLLGTCVLALVVGFCGCVRRPPASAPRQFQGAMADIGPRLNNYSEATVPQNGSIVVRGDAFLPTDIAGAPVRGKARASISLADALAKAVGVASVDQMQPGATLGADTARLADAPVGSLLVICYGYGDAVAGTDVVQFQAGLQQMIRSAHNHGAAVYVVVEPTTTFPRSASVEPYRIVARQAAAAEGAGLIDAPPALAAAGLGPSKTKAQPTRAVALIAGLIAQYVRVAPNLD